jgi:FhuF 2Fe-2S C-terminal domain
MPMTDRAQIAAALAAAAAHGPYFGTDPAPGGGWLRLSDVHLVWPGRVAATGAALARAYGVPAVEPRVAASVAHLGLVARLVAPVVALAAGAGLVLDGAPAAVWWQPVLGRPCPLSFPDPTGDRPDRADLAARLGASLHTLAAPVTAAAGGSARLPDGLLRGNVMSGIAGAIGQLGTDRRLLDDLLATRHFAGTGRWDGGRFRRRSCCLIYRAGGGICGDCCLRTG